MESKQGKKTSKKILTLFCWCSYFEYSRWVTTWSNNPFWKNRVIQTFLACSVMPSVCNKALIESSEKQKKKKCFYSFLTFEICTSFKKIQIQVKQVLYLIQLQRCRIPVLCRQYCTVNITHITAAWTALHLHPSTCYTEQVQLTMLHWNNVQYSSLFYCC